jgi:hypothetical protein
MAAAPWTAGDLSGVSVAPAAGAGLLFAFSILGGLRVTFAIAPQLGQLTRLSTASGGAVNLEPHKGQRIRIVRSTVRMPRWRVEIWDCEPAQSITSTARVTIHV